MNYERTFVHNGDDMTEQELTISKGDRTRLALIDVAYALFVEQGFHGTSMRQIAEGAGLALGGIYNHFANKEEIFKAVVFTYHPFVKVIPQLTAVPHTHAATMLRRVIRLFGIEMQHDRGIFNLLFIELIEMKSKHVSEMAELLMPSVLPFLQDLMTHSNQLRVQDPMVILRMLIGTMLSFYLTGQMMSGTVLDTESTRSIEPFIDILLNGLLTDQENES